MKTYTREELIAELARNVSVSWKSYGTWKVESEIDCIEVGEITHNEEDNVGIMDGEKYNPQDYEDWLYYFCDDDDLTEEEKRGMFQDYCESVWADSANEENYESREERDIRLAERLFDGLIEDDRIAICKDGYLVLTESEAEFLCNNNGWRADLYEGKLEDFSEAFKEWEDEK